MKKSIPNRDAIFLTEWDDLAMVHYADKIESRSSNGGRLKEFASLLRAGKYEEIYGDIPKRPLFLNMLVEDAISGRIGKTTLSYLHEEYVLRKMRYDQESPFGDTSRLLPSNKLDLHDLQRRLLGMLERLALKTAVAGEIGDTRQLLEKFPESWVKEAAQMEELPKEQVISFLMNTILVTASTRSISKELDVRFAHRSFQEYFVARRLVSLLKDGADEEILHFWGVRYNLGVVKFVKEILNDIRIHPDRFGEFHMCIERLRQITATLHGECLLIDMLKVYSNIPSCGPLSKPIIFG